ncbi:MAG: hypothetical protein M3323_08560 [Actinomycetota bacterium]|nr:hypothetical protein [Actinomycetota bacterium]
MAKLNGETIPLYEVAGYVRPRSPRIGTGAIPNPRAEALREVVQTRLFAAEATRRGFQPIGSTTAVKRASLARALINQIFEGRTDLTVKGISLRNTRSFYREHRGFFHEVEGTRVGAIVVRDQRLAERLLSQSEGAGRDRFEQLARRYSIHPSGARGGTFGTIHADDLEVPAAMGRTVMWMREPGEVGLVQIGSRYFVLRALKLHLEPAPWDRAQALRVRTYMVSEMREDALEHLYKTLRNSVVLEVDRHALRRIPIPTWREYSSG